MTAEVTRRAQPRLAATGGTMVPIDCAWCGSRPLRILGEVNRAKRAGSPIFCNAACSGLAHRAKDARASEHRRAQERARWNARMKDPGEIRKRKARTLVQTAVINGTLARLPCEVCGATPAEAHHDDYSRPLDVRWLCPSHHREHHLAADEEVA